MASHLSCGTSHISVCLKAIGNSGRWGRALQHCLDSSVERDVAEEIKAHVRQLDREVLKTLSGLVGALEKYQSPKSTLMRRTSSSRMYSRRMASCRCSCRPISSDCRRQLSGNSS